MDSSRCSRCRAREGSPLCPVCTAAGPVLWHASDWRTWLPAASACALLAVAATLIVGALAVYSTAGKWLQADPMHSLRLAAQGWWMALGAPVSTSADVSEYGTFRGVLRLSTMALVVPCSFFLFMAGCGLARLLRAAAEVEHLIAGSFVALPAALVSAAAASLLPFSISGLRVGDVHGDVQLAVTPLHAAAVTLLWALAFCALGGLCRYWWLARLFPDRWAGLRAGAWPAVCGGSAALMLAVLLSSATTLVESRLIDSRLSETLGCSSSLGLQKTLAQEALATMYVGITVAPLAFDSGVPIEGRALVGAPATIADLLADTPTDTRLRVHGCGGVSAEDPGGRVRASLPARMMLWLIVPLLSAVLGGRLAAGLAPDRPRWRVGLGTGLTYALGALGVMAWVGAWVTGTLVLEVSPASYELWVAWQPVLWPALWMSALLGLAGALAGALTRA